MFMNINSMPQGSEKTPIEKGKGFFVKKCNWKILLKFMQDTFFQNLQNLQHGNWVQAAQPDIRYILCFK